MNSKPRSYVYEDEVRVDILRMIPPDGHLIGSIGCGYAATEAQLVGQGRIVHGADVSAHAIEVARTRLSSAKVIASDDWLPFEPLSLDGLILADVLEHIPNAWDALRSFISMVKPGGWIVISVPNMRRFDVLLQLVVKGDWPEAPVGVFDSTHIQVMTHKRLLRWCRDAGLAHERWFDNHDFRFWRRNIFRALDYGTLRLLRSFLEFQIQGRFRREISQRD